MRTVCRRNWSARHPCGDASGETMPVMTLYEEVENVLTNRLKNALHTSAHRLRVPPASEMTRITTFSPMGPPSAASSKPMQRPSVHRGFGRWRSGITKTASRRTAMPRRARQRWRRSRKAGGANDWPRTSRPPKAIRLWVRSGRKTTMRRWFAIFQRFVHRHPPFSWGQTALRPSPFAGARYLR